MKQNPNHPLVIQLKELFLNLSSNTTEEVKYEK